MENITEIYADKIIEPTDPMRSDMDRDKIDDLAASIKQQGLIQPITVRPIFADGSNTKLVVGVGEPTAVGREVVKYEVVAGHRRFKACAIAGIVKIPCIVKEMTDQDVLAIRAHENLFRDDINPVDESIYIGKLVGDDETKISEIAKLLNRSVQWVEDRLNILTYPDYFIPAVRNKKLSLGVAKWLAAIDDDVYRKMFFNSAVNNGMAIWQAEYYYNQYAAGVFKNSSEVIPADDSIDRPVPASVKAPCARCGEMAEAPNLQSVFTHITCPQDSTNS